MNRMMRHSGTYTTSKPITMAELFDGRLGLYGIFEWDAWHFFADTYEDAILAGFNPCDRCLTTFLCCDCDCEHWDDEEGNYVWVDTADENDECSSDTVCVSVQKQSERNLRGYHQSLRR